ncbi:hypothetical protein [Erythrobacter sp. WG]|uniref:hypothetical protein n=1 Tax=Erythrobacter sp. WG TaxID=2985510 RepID=UPI002271539D|nr:hypothetical protein [Erythrobacter sp. WG]MCX9146397.1 hypothetical protein [Erythrobacter sp. WG]
MSAFFVGVVFSFVIVCVAIWANAHFANEKRLPMKWWLNGEVTWSAPRPIALAFFPAISIASLFGFSLLLSYSRPRPGQEGMVVPAFIALGAIFVAVQLFHVWMADRTLRRKGE